MLGRLLIGIVKGLIVGSLLGFGLVKLGLGMPGAIVAYLAAALTGVLIGLVAGKPIWAKDARIEAGAKAIIGALLGVGLMAAARNWLMAIPLPFSLGPLSTEGATVGGFAMTALAGIAAILGGFYEADNDSSGEEGTPPTGSAKSEGDKGQKRIAASVEHLGDEDEDVDVEPEKKRSKK